MSRKAISLKNQVRIELLKAKKVFRLIAPIYFSSQKLPFSVQQYAEKRKGFFFKPYRTYFQLKESFQVDLIQEISFKRDFQTNLRKDLVQFWQIALHCHRMLAEIAAEEAQEAWSLAKISSEPGPF